MKKETIGRTRGEAVLRKKKFHRRMQGETVKQAKEKPSYWRARRRRDRGLSYIRAISVERGERERAEMGYRQRHQKLTEALC